MTRPVKTLTVGLWVLAVAGMVWVVAYQLWVRDPPEARAGRIWGSVGFET